VIEKSTKRASKWMTLREEVTTPMVGQVGGRSHNKKPILTVKKSSSLRVSAGNGAADGIAASASRDGGSAVSAPYGKDGDDGPVNIEDHEYVLKPVASDHRGIREIAFYEAIEVVTHQHSKSKPPVTSTASASASTQAPLSSSKSSSSSSSPQSAQSPSPGGSLSQAYAQFLSGGDIMGGGQGTENSSRWRNALNMLDAVALALAMMLQDSVIQKSEEDLKRAWKAVRREAESLHRLSKFVPRCRGVVRIGIKKRQPSIAAAESDSATPAQPLNLTQSEAATSSQDQSQGGTLDEEPTIPPGPPPPAPGAPSPSVSSAWSCSSSFGVPDDAYLLLQSLTRTYARPCVMDLKMGTETYEPDCTDEKRRRESSKYAMQDVFGFRIIGMRIYEPHHDDADDKGFRLFSKEYGRSLVEREQVSEAFRLFFSAGLKKQKSGPADSNGSSSAATSTSPRPRRPDDGQDADQRLRLKAVSSVLLQLRSLRRWFEEHNTSLQFRASSLLFIYEGDPSRGGNGDVTMLKMIDFGHVRRVPGGDAGYLTGIKNLTQILTEILEDQEEKRQQAPPTRITADQGTHTNELK
jgi:Inositol polyphosphate kinase